MTIYVNARFLTHKITGVERFAIEISKKLKEKWPNIIFVSPKNIINKEIADQLEVKIIGNLCGHLWEQITLPLYLKKNNNSLLLNLTNTAPLLYKNKLVTIHDISPLTNPEWYSIKFSTWYRFFTPLIAKYSHAIFTVSNFCKAEIINTVKINPNKVHVIYNALPEIFRISKEKILIGKKKYVLCVSSINPRKNFERIIEAFLSLNFTDYKLYIVGSKRDNFAQIGDVSVENIEFLGRVTDEELIELYRNATGFIFVSLYEGFGIPILEAQALGCPVLASNITTHQEIMQFSGLMCDPYNVESIANGIDELVNLSKKKYIEKGLENVKRFSWEKSSDQIISISNYFLSKTKKK